MKALVGLMVVSRRGVVAVLLANVLFGLLYVYGHLMKPMQGTDVFAWRMVAMLVALTVLMSMLKGWPAAKLFVKQLNQTPWHWGLFGFSTAVIALNFWLFVWGPVNGYGIDVAMGYFLLPLTTILMGMAVFGERLNVWQKWAIAFASMGVGYQMWVGQGLSWVAMLCCLSYPFYYGIRRYLKTPALVGLWLDLVLIAPISLVYLLVYSDSLVLVFSQWQYVPLIVMLGIISAVAMFWLMYGMRTLPMTLFSMLTYGEPILLFVLAVLFLGAPLTVDAVVTYGLIWVGFCLMLWDGYLQLRQPKPKTMNQNDVVDSGVATSN